jgi:bacterioferritin-associated ferredoxin
LILKMVFNMMGSMEGSVGLDPSRPWAPAMTRCECTELSFDEVARRVGEGTPLEEVQERTGCGRLCSACLPDLRAHLACRR